MTRSLTRFLFVAMQDYAAAETSLTVSVSYNALEIKQTLAITLQVPYKAPRYDHYKHIAKSKTAGKQRRQIKVKPKQINRQKVADAATMMAPHATIRCRVCIRGWSTGWCWNAREYWEVKLVVMQDKVVASLNETNTQQQDSGSKTGMEEGNANEIIWWWIDCFQRESRGRCLIWQARRVRMRKILFGWKLKLALFKFS